jgi:hypothetical protein
MKPVVLATTVAWVGAYIAASQWLQRFAYHTDLDPRLFVLAAALAAVIALLVVITHIAKITSAHPVWLQRRVE